MDKKISQLGATITAGNTDLLAIVQGGVTKKITFENFIGSIITSSSLNLSQILSNGNNTDGNNITITSGDLIRSEDGLSILTITNALASLTCDGVGISSNYSYSEISGEIRFINLNPDTVPYLGSSKELVSSSITPTELGYLSGATSNLQSQINAISGGVSSVLGTANRITSSGGSNPVIDIAATYIGQTSITTIGTIGTGTWQGTSIGPTFGGTGLTSIASGSIIAANSLNTFSAITSTSGNKELINDSGAISWATVTGTGAPVRATSPTLVTPILGVATATSIGIGVVQDSELTVSKQSAIVSPPAGTLVHFIGLDANSLRLSLDTHNNAGAGGTAFLGRRSRGTAASPSAVLADDTIITMNGVGYGTSAFGSVSTGLISIKAGSNFTDTSQETYISFLTTPATSVTAVEAMRIKGNRNVNFTAATASTITLFDANKDLISASTATYPSPTELSYGKGVTSPIQTQLDAKLKYTVTARTSTASPADATTYFLGMLPGQAVATTDTLRRWKFPTTGNITDVNFNIQQTGNGSNETVTIKLKNITTATTYTVGTFTSDFGANTVVSFIYNGLTIPVTNITDYWVLQIDPVTWTTNPSSWIIAADCNLR